MKKVIPALILSVCTASMAADALGGAGKFNSTGSLTGWTKYIYSTTTNSAAYYGSIKININDDGDYVAEFWSNERSGLDEWDIQLKKTFTLETGYAYTIQTGFYSYDEYGTYGRAVQMGVLDADFDTYFAEEFVNSTGEYEDFEGTTYKHCGATDTKAIFFINGGTQYGGFAIPWVVIDKQPITCGSTTPTSSASVVINSSTSTQLTGNGKGPVSQYGQLQAGTNASGQGRIYGSCPTWSVSGKEVQVKGMSLFWSINPESASFWDASVVTRMVQDYNIQLIRAAMGVDENWGDGNYFTETSYYQGLMDKVVQAAIDNDIYVIIDYHSHRAHENVADAKDFFSRMASKWGSYDNVIFEIFNEPACITGGSGDCSDAAFGGGFVSWSTIKTYANQVISTIRQYSDNLVIVGTPMWDQQPNAAIGSKVTDTANNTAYAFHYYAGTHSTSSEGNNAVKAMNAGLSVFVSEWGTINADGKGAVASANTGWQSWMNTYKLSSANWSLTSLVEDASQLYGGDGQGGSFFAAGVKPSSATWTLSASGSWLNTNVFSNLPTSYTACEGATIKSSSSTTIIASSSSAAINPTSSATLIASSTSVIPPASSASVTPASSASVVVIPPTSSTSTDLPASSAAVASGWWTSDNTKLTENTRESTVIGDLLIAGEKRTLKHNVTIEAAGNYTVSFKAATASGENTASIKVYDESGKLIELESDDISPKSKTIACKFFTTPQTIQVVAIISDPLGVVTLSDFTVSNGTDAIRTQHLASFNIAVQNKTLQIQSVRGESVKVQVFDMMGNAVVNTKLSVNTGSASVSLDAIPNGNYIIRVAGKNSIKSVKASLK